MCLFAAGLVAALVPSAIFFGLMIWRGGIEDEPWEADGQVVPFPRPTGKSAGKATPA
jgi:hypothetical protein